MNSSLSGLVESFHDRLNKEREFVLATIVETAGSTYRKAGARMLISRDGELCGLLSGGCLEADLYEHAKQVFQQRTSNTVFYDMRSSEDLIWGLGLGCDGAVRIRLDYLGEANDYAPLSLIERALETGTPAVVLTVTESEHETVTAGSHYLFPADNNDLPAALAEAARAVLEDGKSLLQSVSVDGRPVSVFLGLVQPPPRLLIIGGGPDAVPVTETARLLGWDITVVDHREAFSTAEKFPAADRVVHAPPETLRQRLDPAGMNAVVLMTHKLEYDQRYLAQLVDAPPTYIGLLGPTARRQELLKYLGDDAAAVEDRVYGPVGLDIGARLPEEIAFSLVAEIQAVLAKREGGFLSRHRPPQQSDAPAASREQLYGILLAAGGSTRFGALKQLLEFNGQSLLRHAAETARSLLDDRLIVVHGPKATKCQREIAGVPAENIVNEDWQAGISLSLKMGLKRLPEQCRGVLVMLCDQPLIQEHHLEQLIDTWLQNPEGIVAGRYEETCGVPAIFPRRLFDELLALNGDAGARSLLAERHAEVTAIPLEEAAMDIDTQADYETLLREMLLSR